MELAEMLARKHGARSEIKRHALPILLPKTRSGFQALRTDDKVHGLHCAGFAKALADSTEMILDRALEQAQHGSDV